MYKYLATIIFIALISACNTQAYTELPSTTLVSSSAVISPTTTIRTAATYSPTLRTLPTITPTFTPQPTLTTGEQDIHVRELLKTNAGCQLPCWWGISPGKTSWKDAEHFLRYLGATIGQTELETGATLHWAKLQGNSSYISPGFIEGEVQEGIVDTIFVGGNHSGTQNQSDFESMWESYSPKQIVTKYGVPSRVLLDTTGETGLSPTGANGYTIWIIYDQLGFMIRFVGFVADLPVYHFCPELQKGADDISHINLTLQYPDNPLPLEWDDAILSTQPSRAKSIQEAAGISVDEFYRLFTQTDEPACFDSPHDIWR